MADRNINPIPIHDPSDMGGMADLTIITVNNIVGFRRWVADFKKLLMAAHDYMGQPHYITVNGKQCYRGINAFESALTKTDPVSEFLYHLGFTEDDVQGMIDFNIQDGQQRIHYIWNPTLGFSFSDFEFWKNYLQGEMGQVAKTVLVNNSLVYSDDDYPNEVDRVPMSYTDMEYGSIKGTTLIEEYGFGEDIRDHIVLMQGTNAYKFYNQYFWNEFDLRFYDSSDNEITFSIEVYSAIKALVAISPEAVASISLTKVGETEHSFGAVNPEVYWQIHMEEEIAINFAAIPFDEYRCYDFGGNPVDDGSCFTEEGPFGETGYAPLYGSAFWGSRDKIIEHTDPVNNEIGMFEYYAPDNVYYLRVDFEKFANPDEISYLISTFSYVDAYTEEEGGFKGFLKGLLSITLVLTGAWLMIATFGSSAPASRKLWQLAGFVAGTTYRQVQKKEFEQEVKEMMDRQAEEMRLREEMAFEQMARTNVADVAQDLLDKPFSINPYALGLFNPMNGLEKPKNDYYIGGEFWNPHKKLQLGA